MNNVKHRSKKIQGIKFELIFAETLKNTCISPDKIITQPLVHLSQIDSSTNEYLLNIFLFIPKYLMPFKPKKTINPKGKFLDIGDTDESRSRQIYFTYTGIDSKSKMDRRVFNISYRIDPSHIGDQHLIIHYLQISYTLPKKAGNLDPEAIIINIDNGLPQPDDLTTSRGTKATASTTNN